MVSIMEMDDFKDKVIVYYDKNNNATGLNASSINYEKLYKLLNNLNMSSIFDLVANNSDLVKKKLKLNVIKMIDTEPDSDSDSEKKDEETKEPDSDSEKKDDETKEAETTKPKQKRERKKRENLSHLSDEEKRELRLQRARETSKRLYYEDKDKKKKYRKDHKEEINKKAKERYKNQTPEEKHKYLEYLRRRKYRIKHGTEEGFIERPFDKDRILNHVYKKSK